MMLFSHKFKSIVLSESVILGIAPDLTPLKEAELYKDETALIR